MWSIFFELNSADQDSLVCELWERGTAGIIEEPGGLRAFFGDDINPASLKGLRDGVAGDFRIELISEATFERENWEPILVGERFFVAAPWIFQAAAPNGRLQLQVDAATAFGTGRHETTQLCLEALERYLRSDSIVIDVGCGSGILSAAAHLLGATAIFSCDIQQDAIRTAQKHVSTPVFTGSADAIRDTCADVVLANISAAVLDRLAFDLKRITKPDGLLVVSGFIAGNTPQHYRPEESLTRGDWLCWMCRPDGVTAIDESAPGEGLSHRAEWWL